MAHFFIKWLFLAIFGFWVIAAPVLAEASLSKPEKYITKPYIVPFERPIGFTLNLAAVASLTAEGRFLLGLAKNFTLVVSPMYQNTIEIPVWKDNIYPLYMDIRRVNLGLGVRGHFYEYDSWDGWYLEALGRGGLTWIGLDPRVWSITPSLMLGHSSVYDSGYTVSIGAGLEWEFLLVRKKDRGNDTKYLKDAYLNITKFPLMGEISIGWIW